MKKLVMIAVMATIAIVCNVNAQQTVVIQNSEEAKKTVGTDGSFYINGISSALDIGGVQAIVTTKLSSRYQGQEVHKCYVALTNYNDFRVTVLYQAGPNKVTGSLVLEPGKTASAEFGRVTTGLGGDIPTEMFSVFTITRRL